MKGKELEKLINPDDYQVFIMRCPAGVPLSFASHPWFVCNERGRISRYEVLFTQNKNADFGHLHIDAFPPFSGIEVLLFYPGWRWRGELLWRCEGDLAKRMIEFIRTSKAAYPYKEYAFTGPNSNTYARWVLNAFPEIDVKLPWNCFGKDYKK